MGPRYHQSIRADSVVSARRGSLHIRSEPRRKRGCLSGTKRQHRRNWAHRRGNKSRAYRVAHAAIRAHRVENMELETTPNFWPDRKGETVRGIVVHVTKGTYESARSWIKNV